MYRRRPARVEPQSAPAWYLPGSIGSGLSTAWELSGARACLVSAPTSYQVLSLLAAEGGRRRALCRDRTTNPEASSLAKDSPQPEGPGPDRSSARDLGRAGPGQSAGRGTPKSPGLLRMKPLSLAM